jgi:hypothetical protein
MPVIQERAIHHDTGDPIK